MPAKPTNIGGASFYWHLEQKKKPNLRISNIFESLSRIADEINKLTILLAFRFNLIFMR